MLLSTISRVASSACRKMDIVGCIGTVEGFPICFNVIRKNKKKVARGRKNIRMDKLKYLLKTSFDKINFDFFYINQKLIGKPHSNLFKNIIKMSNVIITKFSLRLTILTTV